MPLNEDDTIPKNCFYNNDQVSSIRGLLLNNSSGSCVRIGGIEADATYRLLKFGYINDSLIYKLKTNAGFYPRSKNDLFKFAIENSLALSNSSVVAYWDSKFQYELFEHIGIQKSLVTLKYLEPFTVACDWLSSINRPVCVISPFVDTMKSQLDNIIKIHTEVDLSRVDFKFVKAPLTNGLYKDSTFNPSWFDRLDELEYAATCSQSRIALIGAGSYGLPLAERLRRRGFVSIVCGGALQLLFGISGRRWQEREDYQKIINSNWVKPSDSEKPIGYEKVEGGCYW